MLITNSFFTVYPNFVHKRGLKFVHVLQKFLHYIYIYECKISIIKGNAIAKFQSKKKKKVLI